MSITENGLFVMTFPPHLRYHAVRMYDFTFYFSLQGTVWQPPFWPGNIDVAPLNVVKKEVEKNCDYGGQLS